jgi:thiamine pyrophosphate-dependent acetolactate synthase large subunit-like protein
MVLNIFFGYPGGAILPIYDELYHWEKANLLKHILVRHEQSAAHAGHMHVQQIKSVFVLRHQVQEQQIS